MSIAHAHLRWNTNIQMKNSPAEEVCQLQLIHDTHYAWTTLTHMKSVMSCSCSQFWIFVEWNIEMKQNEYPQPWQSASSSNTGTIFSKVNKHRKWFLLFKRNYVSIKVSLFSLSSYELLEIIFVWCWVISSPICISIMNVVLIFSSYCRIKARTKSTMIKNSMNMR